MRGKRVLPGAMLPLLLRRPAAWGGPRLAVISCCISCLMAMQALDLGAAGIMVPTVNTVSDVEKAVSAMYCE